MRNKIQNALFFSLAFLAVISRGEALDCLKGDLKFSGEWLYQEPCYEQFFVATLVDRGRPEDVTPIQEIQPKSFGMDITSGFRLGVTYSSCSECLPDICLVWTRQNSDESRTVKKPLPMQIILFPSSLCLKPGIPLPGAAPNNIKVIKGSWHCDLDIVDLKWKGRFCCGECYELNHNIGLKYLSIDQDYKNRVFFDPNTVIPTIIQTYNQDFDGVGPSIGLNVRWNLLFCLGLYGDLSTSLIYGKIDSKTKLRGLTATTFQFPIGVTPPSDYNLKNHNLCLRQVTDLELGLYIETSLWECVNVKGKVGWNTLYLNNLGIFDGAIFCNLSSDIKNNDLSYQGLVLGLEAGF